MSNATIIDEATEQLAGYVSSILADNSIDQAAELTECFESCAAYLKANVTKVEPKGKPMPQLDIMKLIAVTEEALMAQVTKHDKETYAQSFSRKYERDIEFRKAWRDLNEQKQLHVHLKAFPNMMSAKPTSTEVGNTNEDGEAEALKAAALLAKLAEKQRALAPWMTAEQAFDMVYANPANKAVIARAHKRPNTSSTSGDELQGEGKWG